MWPFPSTWRCVSPIPLIDQVLVWICVKSSNKNFWRNICCALESAKKAKALFGSEGFEDSSAYFLFVVRVAGSSTYVPRHGWPKLQVVKFDGDPCNWIKYAHGIRSTLTDTCLSHRKFYSFRRACLRTSRSEAHVLLASTPLSVPRTFLKISTKTLVSSSRRTTQIFTTTIFQG